MAEINERTLGGVFMHRALTLRLPVLAILAALSGCGGDSGDAAQGVDGAQCYPNGTCNAGLACSGDSVCVAVSGDAAVDAAADRGEVCVGNFVINNSIDLDLFVEANCEEVTGYLEIEIDTAISLPISLPVLKTVGGKLVIGRPPTRRDVALTDLNLPALTTVGRGLYITDTTLTDLNLPALVSVGIKLQISSNPALMDISLPALATVQEMAIVSNAALCQSIVDEIVSRVDVGGETYASRNRDGC